MSGFLSEQVLLGDVFLCTMTQNTVFYSEMWPKNHQSLGLELIVWLSLFKEGKRLEGAISLIDFYQGNTLYIITYTYN